MNCHECRAVMAYKDLHGKLHTTEMACAKRNEEIKLRELMDDYELGYRKLWPEYFQSPESMYHATRHEVLLSFIDRIGKDGYAITKV